MIIVLFGGGGCCGAGEVPDRVWRVEFGEGCEKKHSRILTIMTVVVAIKPKNGL